jgi:hypothetical protein
MTDMASKPPQLVVFVAFLALLDVFWKTFLTTKKVLQSSTSTVLVSTGLRRVSSFSALRGERCKKFIAERRVVDAKEHGRVTHSITY